MIRRIQHAFVALAAAVFSAGVTAADLSGEWEGDDGGTYYLTQEGAWLYWYGERDDENPAWSNVFRGRVYKDHVSGTWVDVPKGRTRNSGKLKLEIRSNGNVLVATSKSGGFGGSRWTRAGYSGQAKPQLPQTPVPTPRVAVQPRTVKEDCVSFNPRNTQLKRVKGRWKIVDGDHWMFDFGNNGTEAKQAYRIIRHYDANQSCFVGRPNPEVAYILVNGKAPSGSIRGEDCLRFNPDNVSVSRSGGHWKVTDGRMSMFAFGSNKEDAEKTVQVIKQHGFRYQCFVGRPHASFQYMRR